VRKVTGKKGDDGGEYEEEKNDTKVPKSYIKTRRTAVE